MRAAKKAPTFEIMEHCIACTTCQLVAKPMFSINESGTMAVILNQPKNDYQIKKSFEALKSCPVSAIGVRSA